MILMQLGTQIQDTRGHEQTITKKREHGEVVEVEVTKPTLRKQSSNTKHPRKRSQYVRQFRIRDTPPSKPHVDLVITLHCDSIDWIKDISPELAPVLTVVILHKVSDEEKKPECNPAIPKIPIDVKYIRLPNAGRDGGSQFTYISKTYHALPTYTMFMQAGNHWFIGNWLPEAHGFDNNSAAVNELVPMALRKKPSFVPVSPYLGGVEGDPILYLDRATNEDKAAQDADTPKNIKKFDAGKADMFNYARDMLGILFGKKPCEHQEEIIFVPGMQYLVQRDLILNWPQTTWEALEDMSLDCDAATYALERLPFHMFNSSKVAVPPELWRTPQCCGSGFVDFGSQAGNPYLEKENWGKLWGCDPLTPFLKAREKTSPQAKVAASILDSKKR